MSIASGLHSLYQDCVNCSNTEQDCPGIWRDLEQGVFPRGFYFLNIPVDVLVVGKNPGHPTSTEKKAYGGLKGEPLYKKLRNERDNYFLSEYWSGKGDVFSRNLVEYLAFFLDVEEKDIFSRAAFTNLVKCCTPIERMKLNKKTKEVCFQKYLKHEVAFLKPKVILALGRESEVFLLRMSWRYLKVPVVYIKHPSYHYKREDESDELEKIKEEIQYYINRNGCL